MKTSAVVGLVAAAHVAGIGALLVLSQGCGTRPVKVEPPPAPVLPPRPVPTPAPTPLPPPPPPVSLTPAPRPLPEERMITYEVRPGDSLSKIAQRYGVTTRELIELNNISDPNRIRVGQKIQLPPHAREVPHAVPSAPAQPVAPRPAPAGSVEHRVMPGETLSGIAQQYGVKVSEIMEANGLGNDRIRAGQKLIIPNPRKKPTTPAQAPAAPAARAPATAPAAPSATATAPAPATPAPPSSPAAPSPGPAADPAASAPSGPSAEPASSTFMYTVQEGDTLESIAQRFMVRVDDLAGLNNLTPGTPLRAGQRIRLPPLD